MEFKYLITFAVGLGVYLVVVGSIALIKWIRNRNSFEKEKDVKENHEQSDEESK